MNDDPLDERLKALSDDLEAILDKHAPNTPDFLAAMLGKVTKYMIFMTTVGYEKESVMRVIDVFKSTVDTLIDESRDIIIKKMKTESPLLKRDQA